MKKGTKNTVKRNGRKENGNKEEGKTRRELRRNEEGRKGIQEKKNSAGIRSKHIMMMMMTKRRWK